MNHLVDSNKMAEALDVLLWALGVPFGLWAVWKEVRRGN